MLTIEIEGITKNYGKQKALDNVSLSIKKGEVVGLLGPNGAGKSTLMKIITSFVPASSGFVRIEGKDVQENPIEIRKHIGYTGDDIVPEIHEEMWDRLTIDSPALEELIENCDEEVERASMLLQLT